MLFDEVSLKKTDFGLIGALILELYHLYENTIVIVPLNSFQPLKKVLSVLVY